MTARIRFHDFKPEGLSLHQAIIQGLSSQEKSIPPKFFYDARGSALFDEICRQPEYYLPDTERAMLIALAGEIARHTGRGRVLIEPGAGNAAKIRLLLDALHPLAYVPMDISCGYLKQAALELVTDYPELDIHAVCVDYSHSLPLPEDLPQGPRLAFFPGSSLGNFEPAEARAFMAMVGRMLGRDGMLLIGVDTKKSREILDAAYNDAAGITAAFNRNLLHRIRRELAAEVDPDAFEHHAFYNQEAGRIEMHLVSREAQRVKINGQRYAFKAGERLHTESSYKYTPREFLSLAAESGFQSRCHWLDREGLFAIYLLDVVRS
jgi:dimethylhistidine N-methyltransferase